MAAVKGQRRRPDGAPSVLVQARVDPDIRDKLHRAAAACGVSLSVFVELLIQHEQLDARDRPLWWTDPLPTDQELPLKSA
ncbi:MAG: hypothetical protein ACRC35_14555 [Angustibacter sp.]